MQNSADRPSQKRERKAIYVLAACVLLAAIVFFGIFYFRTSPEKVPTGEAPGTTAPNAVETPEGAKPPAQRDSN